MVKSQALLHVVLLLLVIAAAAAAAAAAAGALLATSGRPKLSEPFKVTNDFSFETPEYVSAALRAPSMAWFLRAVTGGPGGPGGPGGANLRERGARSTDEYLARYVSEVEEPRSVDEALRTRVRGAVQVAMRAVETAVANGDAPAEMASGLLTAPVWPWRVALLRDERGAVEGGMPHTVHDLIVLPRARVSRSSRSELASLLVHEATHVYQRMRRAQAHEVLRRDFGLVRLVRSSGEGRIDRAIVRANPDTDDRDWAAEKPDGGLAIFPLPVFQGGGFRDVALVGGAEGGFEMPGEHPYEVMAYSWQRAAEKYAGGADETRSGN